MKENNELTLKIHEATEAEVSFEPKYIKIIKGKDITKINLNEIIYFIEGKNYYSIDYIRKDNFTEIRPILEKNEVNKDLYEKVENYILTNCLNLKNKKAISIKNKEKTIIFLLTSCSITFILSLVLYIIQQFQ